MGRSKWKKYYISINLLNKKTSNIQTKVYQRNSTIPMCLLNKNVLIHNGRAWFSQPITTEKIGHKFGEYVFTRTIKGKGKKNKTKNKKIK